MAKTKTTKAKAKMMGNSYASKIEWIAKYQKSHIKQVALKFNKEYDYIIIKKLESCDNKNDYIRQLILKDIASACNEDKDTKK